MCPGKMAQIPRYQGIRTADNTVCNVKCVGKVILGHASGCDEIPRDVVHPWNACDHAF